MSPFIFNTPSTLSETPTQWFPNFTTSPLSSYTSTISSTPPTWPNHTWKAPDRKAPENTQNQSQEALAEATKRAAIAERKAAEYLQAKDSAELQLRESTAAKAALSASNEQLTAEIRRLKEDFHKLEKHNKNCAKAATKAQNEAKHAKGFAEHTINSQKGQLKNAERRFAEANRELKEWKERYGCAVEKPAEEKAALQVRLLEGQSKAEKARNTEIAVLKGGLQGQQGDVEAGDDSNGTAVEESQSSINVEQHLDSAVVAAAQAAKYKEERDRLYRLLREEMARNEKLAESLVLRNAQLGESLEGWETHGGEA